MAITTAFSGGLLTVVGNSAADTVNFRQNNGLISIAGLNKTWNASQVSSISISLLGGADRLSLNSLANGGNQTLAENFTIKSGDGVDVVRLANGKDVTMNGANHTLTVSSAGVATLDGTRLNWVTPTPSPNPTPNPTPSNWFDANVVDAALRTLGHNLYADGRIDRRDIIALLKNVEDGGTVDATELSDLKKIVGNSTLFAGLDYVKALSGYIVNGNAANAHYQSQNLGNLAAGSTTAQMENLINKWFLGLDRPTASGTYRQVAGSLFVNGATYGDVNQGYLGDCYFMASLGEVALKSPSTITNMFVVNGDGTYTVKFFNNGTAAYVTVDSFLPTDSGGRLIYAGLGKLHTNASNELWTSLAEKAYVQINEMGWLRGWLSGNGQNSYSAVEGGYIYAALGQITGQATTPFTATAGNTSFTAFVTAFNQGKMIGFASMSTPASNQVVGGHAYAVVGYDATNQTVTLFNPWGTQYGLVTMTWSQIQGSYAYFDRTA